MKGIDIYAAIGEADEGFIAEAAAENNMKTADRANGGGRLKNPLRRIAAAAAAIAAAVLLGSAAVFGARPALAAEVPLVNRIVYAAAPERTASEADRQRIEALLSEAFRSLAFNDYDAASRCFRDGSISGRDNYLAAAYIDHLLVFGDEFPQSAEAGELEISELRAEQKAYRFTASVKLRLISRDGKRQDNENCTVRIWENAQGMLIESMEFGSEAYSAFVEEYEETFGAVPESGASLEMIPVDSAYLSYVRVTSANEGARQREDRLYRLIGELEAVPAAPGAKAVRYKLYQKELGKVEIMLTPETITAEETAAELMYRYWLARKTGETGEFDDIMLRNEATDLFYWDALLNAEKVSHGVLYPLAIVEKGSAQILETLEETNDTLRARFYVHTDISDGVSRGVGEEVILTLKKIDGGFIVVGFDREVGDGLYLLSLKPAAARFRAEGYSWQESGRMAYEEAHEQLERDAEWLAEH